MIPTQDMYNVSQQQSRNIHVKINLLNFQFQTVDELSGNTLEMPQITEDANSDTRKTISMSLVVEGDEFDIRSGGKIWLDKYVQIYIGIENIYTDEIVWMNQGIFLINEPSFSYDATTNLLAFQGIDLMSKLTGMRNGYLEGVEHIIPIDSNIKDSVVSTLKLAGFEKYIIDIDEAENKTQYEIKIDIGGTVFDILKALSSVYPFYQIYFDEDGVFHFNKIPTGDSESVVADDNIWKQIYISHTNAVDFSAVKNSIVVLGKSYDVKYFGATVTVSGSQYTTSIANLTTLTDDIIIGAVLPSVVNNPTLKINNFAVYPIVNEDGSPAVIPEGDRYYVVTYKKNKYYFLGYQQPEGIAKDENPDSPFYINGTTGEIRFVLYGGDYDVIPSNSLAKQRANYELYLRARVTNQIMIQCVPLYWISVHTLINFTLPNEIAPKKYMIQSISTGDTQTITASEYFPAYPIY